MDEGIVRQIQIDLITGEYNPIIVWFKTLWDYLERHEISNMIQGEIVNDVVYYRWNSKNKKESIFYFETNTQLLKCSYKYYWEEFRMKFDMEYGSTQHITKIIFDHFNNTGSKPILTSKVESAIIDIIIND